MSFKPTIARRAIPRTKRIDHFFYQGLVDCHTITLHLDKFENGVRELSVPALYMTEEVILPLHESQLPKAGQRAS